MCIRDSYPADEVRGEGIFIEFNQEDIDSWIEAHPAVVELSLIHIFSAREEYIGIIRDELLGPGSEFSLPDREHEPVSYTHLDVYKRQHKMK